MTLEPHLGAVFADRNAAEAAVDDLRRAGLGEQHLGLAIRGPEDQVLEQDVDAELAHGVEKGIAIGAPIGAIAGMTVLALIVPGLGTLGVGGILVAGGISGALAGTYLGGFLGLTAEEHVLEEGWDWERLPLQPGQVLVVVAEHGDPDQVTDILQRHGGELVAKPPKVT